MREYNDRKFYDFFNNPFPFYCGSPDLNLSPMPMGDSPHPNKRARYTSDPLPDSISVTSVNNVSTLTTPSGYPQVIVINYYDPKNHHTIMSEKPFCFRGGGGGGTDPISMME